MEQKRNPSGELIEVSTLPRKTSKSAQAEMHNGTVPQTDTGGSVEKTKANE